MARSADVLASELVTRTRGLDIFVKRLETLYASGNLLKIDLDRSYGGAYMEYFVFLENQIERLFVGLLVHSIVHPRRRVRPLVDIKSPIVAIRIVNGNRAYADWLPYEATVKRAKAYFAGGEPFTCLSSQDMKILERAHTLRNAIAHRSKHSINKFKESFVAGKAIPPSQQTPQRYLRGEHAMGQTRLNLIMSEGNLVFDKLTRL